MPDNLKSNAVDVEVFSGVEGSQTSTDGQGFALHARRWDGRDDQFPAHAGIKGGACDDAFWAW